MEHINPQYIQTFVRLIEDSQRPIVVTHAKPDGDAIGSSTAMLHFLLAAGKSNAKIILNDNPPRFLQFLTKDIEDKIMTYDAAPEKVATEIKNSDLIICLDFKQRTVRTGKKHIALRNIHHFAINRGSIQFEISRVQNGS